MGQRWIPVLSGSGFGLAMVLVFGLPTWSASVWTRVAEQPMDPDDVSALEDCRSASWRGYLQALHQDLQLGCGELFLARRIAEAAEGRAARVRWLHSYMRDNPLSLTQLVTIRAALLLLDESDDPALYAAFVEAHGGGALGDLDGLEEVSWLPPYARIAQKLGSNNEMSITAPTHAEMELLAAAVRWGGSSWSHYREHRSHVIRAEGVHAIGMVSGVGASFDASDPLEGCTRLGDDTCIYPHEASGSAWGSAHYIPSFLLIRDQGHHDEHQAAGAVFLAMVDWIRAAGDSSSQATRLIGMISGQGGDIGALESSFFFGATGPWTRALLAIEFGEALGLDVSVRQRNEVVGVSVEDVYRLFDRCGNPVQLRRTRLRLWKKLTVEQVVAHAGFEEYSRLRERGSESRGPLLKWSRSLLGIQEDSENTQVGLEELMGWMNAWERAGPQSVPGGTYLEGCDMRGSSGD